MWWWTRKKSGKHSALGRLCRKGCCAVRVVAGCLSSISGGYDHRGVILTGLVGDYGKDFEAGYPILTISAIVSFSSQLVTLYPRFTSSLWSVSSSMSVSEYLDCL